IYHRHVGDEIDRNGEFASLFWKDEACEPVSIRILLPVHEVLRRRDFERVAFDPRAAMGGRAQPNDLRREADRPVVAVPCEVVEAGEDGHTLSCYTKTAFILRDFAMQFMDRLAPPPCTTPRSRGGQPRAGPRAITTLERTIRLNRRRNGGWNRGGRG